MGIDPVLSRDEWDAIRASQANTPRGKAAAAAKHTHPPYGERWRVVRDPHVFTPWRCVVGQMQCKNDLHGWLDTSHWQWNSEGWNITPERVKMWADLYANPTEPDPEGI